MNDEPGLAENCVLLICLNVFYKGTRNCLYRRMSCKYYSKVVKILCWLNLAQG